jgi:hypothetical protein
LGRFITGLMYDVGTTLANYLLAEGFAVPAESDVPALVLPIHDVQDVIFSKKQVAEAAERPPRRRRTSPRRKS